MALTTTEPLSFRQKPARRRAVDQNAPPPVVTTPATPIQPPYYFEDGMRKVRPYHFTYNTYCKERWRGRELLEIFLAEFRDRPEEYYKSAIERGLVTINGQETVSVNTIVRNGDVVSHTLHRHEPPISDKPIGIVHEDDDMIVINKPASLPVHPAGRYNFNSVIEIMRSERSYDWTPLPCNRLDRLTSGVMFIGKHPRAAEKISVQIQNRNVKKEYIARVIGEFPTEDTICEQPVMQVSPKLGLNRIRATGKSAKTVFKRLAYYPPVDIDGKAGSVDRDAGTEESGTKQAESSTDSMPWKSKRGHSIVRCLPVTGRTHQIRVHLQFLGHPISNDPIYCNRRVFGPNLAAGDVNSDDDSEIISRLSKMGKTETADAMAYLDEMVVQYDKKQAERMSGVNCEVCETPLYTDPGPHEMGIYLHAKRYACGDGKWAYETPLPEWALPPEGMEGPTEATSETDPTAVLESEEKKKAEES